MSVADLRNEVLMGPSAHHVDPQRLDALLAEVDGSLPVTISVSLTTYRRPA
jgi:23S rRNA (guanine745-N1)-methyltransferase